MITDGRKLVSSNTTILRPSTATNDAVCETGRWARWRTEMYISLDVRYYGKGDQKKKVEMKLESVLTIMTIELSSSSES